MTIDVYLKNANFVRNSLQDETERILLSKENEIVNLNIKQIENGTGNDGIRLSNDIMRNGKQAYTGLYTLSTQLINPRKTAGKQYDFRETGNFLNNFELYINPNLTQIEIFSTGTGSNEKADFFRGYKNIFGLDKENQSKLNYSIILPELQKYVNKYL